MMPHFSRIKASLLALALAAEAQAAPKPKHMTRFDGAYQDGAFFTDARTAITPGLSLLSFA